MIVFKQYDITGVCLECDIVNCVLIIACDIVSCVIACDIVSCVIACDIVSCMLRRLI